MDLSNINWVAVFAASLQSPLLYWEALADP